MGQSLARFQAMTGQRIALFLLMLSLDLLKNDEMVISIKLWVIIRSKSTFFMDK